MRAYGDLPAFPSPAERDRHGDVIAESQQGIDVRTYIAAKLLAAIAPALLNTMADAIANGLDSEVTKTLRSSGATFAVRMADALIEELNK